MKLKEYKGYDIHIQEQSGDFSIQGQPGSYDTLKKAEAYIDKLLKSEIKGKFPVDVVSKSFKVGKITSANALDGTCWFSVTGGDRSKTRISDYAGKPSFYSSNDNNLALAQRYKELEETAHRISREQRSLEQGLTDPIIFETGED